MTDLETAEIRIKPTKLKQITQRIFTRRFCQLLTSILCVPCSFFCIRLAHHEMENARVLHTFYQAHHETILNTRRCMYDNILNVAALVFAEREAALLFTAPNLERHDDAALLVARTRDGVSHPYYSDISLTFRAVAVYRWSAMRRSSGEKQDSPTDELDDVVRLVSRARRVELSALSFVDTSASLCIQRVLNKTAASRRATNSNCIHNLLEQ
eukprot:gene3760-4704_t